MVTTSGLTIDEAMAMIWISALALQAMGTWGIGSVSAMLAAYQTPIQQIGNLKGLRRTARVVVWQLSPLALIVVSLRLIAVAAIAISWVENAGYDDWLYVLFFNAHILVLVLGELAIVSWVIGPWLRIRYNAALGILAGTRASERAERIWLALVAQLGVSVAGRVAFLWGQAAIAIALMLILIINMPSFYSGAGSISLVGARFAPYTALAGILGIGGYLIGQTLLPGLYLRLALQRLNAARSATGLPAQTKPDSPRHPENASPVPQQAGKAPLTADDTETG